MAIRKPTIIRALAPIETRLARIIAYGVTARGSLVSSARSAAPSHPMKQYMGSSAARMKPYHSELWLVRAVEVRIEKPARWWKKATPTSSSSAATTEPTISKNTPTLFTALTSLMLTMLITAAATIAPVASSTMSP